MSTRSAPSSNSAAAAAAWWIWPQVSGLDRIFAMLFLGEKLVRGMVPALAAAFVGAIFGWGVGFYGPPVFLHAVLERTGWPLTLVSGATAGEDD